MKEMTKDQIQEGIQKGDMTIINGVISGEIQAVEAIQPQVEQPATQTDIPVVENKEQPPAQTPIIDPYQEEIESARRYAEMTEKRYKEENERIYREKEELLRKQREAEDKLKQEIAAKEDIAKRLRQLEEMQNTHSTVQKYSDGRRRRSIRV